MKSLESTILYYDDIYIYPNELGPIHLPSGPPFRDFWLHTVSLATWLVNTPNIANFMIRGNKISDKCTKNVPPASTVSYAFLPLPSISGHTLWWFTYFSDIQKAILNFKDYEEDVSQFVACNTNVEYVVIEAEEAPVIVDETPEENNGDIPDEADNNNAEEEKKGEDDEQPEQDAVGESQEMENANNEEQQNDNPDADTVSKFVTKKCNL